MFKALSGGVAVPRDLPLEHIDGRLPLIPRAPVRLQDSLSVSAADQIVIAHKILLAGDGLVVAQQVDGVHVAVHEVPGAIVEDLRDAMPHQSRRGDFEARLAPLAGQADGVVAARVVAINIEDFHGIEQFVIVPFEVEAMLDFLPPEGPGLLPVGHPRLDGPGHDPIEAAEVVMAVGEPGIDHIGPAHVLHPDGAIRLPGLLEGLPDPLGRAAVPAVHRAPLDHDVLDPSIGDLLHVPLRHVGRVMVRRPRGHRVVRRRPQEQDGPGQQCCPHVLSSRTIANGSPTRQSQHVHLPVVSCLRRSRLCLRPHRV